MSVEWFSDSASRMVHAQLSEHMKPLLARMMPNHELSHLGISRNPMTEEVIIKLHLNQIGSVRVVAEEGGLRDQVPRLP